MNNEFLIDTDYCPNLAEDIDVLDGKKDSVRFILIKIASAIPGETNITLLENTEENIENINKLKAEGAGIAIIGAGEAEKTTITELMYGLNFSTRNLFRSKVGDLAQAFTEGDRALRTLMSE